MTADATTKTMRIAATAGLPLLAVVLYTDISDVLMRHFVRVSLLQVLIAVLAIVVWRFRAVLHPATAMDQPVVFFLLLYALIVLSTTIWARDLGAADATLSEVLKSVFVCILAATLLRSTATLRRTMLWVVAAAAMMAAISIVQITTGGLHNAIGGLLQPQSGTLYEHLSQPRAAGPPNSDPNFYARVLLLAIPVAIAASVAERNRLGRLVWAGAAAIVTLGTLFTYSRGAMLALVAMAVLLAAGFRVRPRTAAIGTAAIVIALALLPSDISRRFVTIELLFPDKASQIDYDSSVEKRKLLVRAGLAMFDDHPWTGVGAGNYGSHYLEYANRVGSSWIDYHPPGTQEHPHGLYFQVASETGLPGLMAFCGALVAALVTLYRARRTFTERGDAASAAMATALFVAIASWMVASVFLHETHLRYIALFFGFAIALSRLADAPAGHVTSTER